jgi:hypothetical protein
MGFKTKIMETLSHPKKVKATKDHNCCFCIDKIKKGEIYFTSTHKQDGTLYDWKTHTYCTEIAERLKMYDDCDEGLDTDSFQESIHSEWFNLMINQFSEDDIKKYSDVINQLRYVSFRQKLMYIIRYYKNIDKTQQP